MTSREARTQRRAAERKAAKQLAKATNTAPVSAPTGFVSQTGIESSKRAEINRQNAQHSTGPCSLEGKLASSGNSLKHGLASGTIIIPGEDPAAFEALLRDLLGEHQPVTPTEELLVNEMAQAYWLSQRAIRFQNECFTESGVDEKRLALFLRYQTTHDRTFHKALSTLMKLKKELGIPSGSGFVSRKNLNRATHEVSGLPDPGFVSQNHSNLPPSDQFVWQNAHGEPHNMMHSVAEAA